MALWCLPRQKMQKRSRCPQNRVSTNSSGCVHTSGKLLFPERNLSLLWWRTCSKHPTIVFVPVLQKLGKGFKQWPQGRRSYGTTSTVIFQTQRGWERSKLNTAQAICSYTLILAKRFASPSFSFVSGSFLWLSQPASALISWAVEAENPVCTKRI